MQPTICDSIAPKLCRHFELFALEFSDFFLPKSMQIRWAASFLNVNLLDCHPRTLRNRAIANSALELWKDAEADASKAVELETAPVSKQLVWQWCYLGHVIFVTQILWQNLFWSHWPLKGILPDKESFPIGSCKTASWSLPWSSRSIEVRTDAMSAGACVATVGPRPEKLESRERE